MAPFQELTRAAQFRRLTPLARQALGDYHLRDASLSPLRYTLNATWEATEGPDGWARHGIPWTPT